MEPGRPVFKENYDEEIATRRWQLKDVGHCRLERLVVLVGKERLNRHARAMAPAFV